MGGVTVQGGGLALLRSPSKGVGGGGGWGPCEGMGERLEHVRQGRRE